MSKFVLHVFRYRSETYAQNIYVYFTQQTAPLVSPDVVAAVTECVGSASLRSPVRTFQQRQYNQAQPSVFLFVCVCLATSTAVAAANITIGWRRRLCTTICVCAVEFE